ncbi:MAG TPA: hypothetical protein VK509_01195 [Polyangiales bacterium]|nr:hypothetical protein [Polyangiales bacterium]
MTCRSESYTGSRVKQKVCMTESERAAEEQDDRAFIDEQQRERSADAAKPGPMGNTAPR